MNITVFLGASEGRDIKIKEDVRELGWWIGKNKHTLIYGGSKTGLMGEIAKNVLLGNGKVIGIEPQFFIDKNLQYEGLTKLIITKDMNERKQKMIEMADCFIAFPGGTGTLEEISEVMSMISLNQLNIPCILYNINGYYNGLKALLNNMTKKGFSSKEKQEKIYFAKDINEIKEFLFK